jgi:hypothetical protein
MKAKLTLTDEDGIVLEQWAVTDDAPPTGPSVDAGETDYYLDDRTERSNLGDEVFARMRRQRKGPVYEAATLDEHDIPDERACLWCSEDGERVLAVEGDELCESCRKDRDEKEPGAPHGRPVTPVAEMTTLDFLTDAVGRVLREGDSAWSWTFFHLMDPAARLRFDRFLVDKKDPLAYEAGSCEHRFKARVLSMAETERQRRATR